MRNEKRYDSDPFGNQAVPRCPRRSGALPKLRRAGLTMDRQRYCLPSNVSGKAGLPQSVPEYLEIETHSWIQRRESRRWRDGEKCTSANERFTERRAA